MLPELPENRRGDTMNKSYVKLTADRQDMYRVIREHGSPSQRDSCDFFSVFLLLISFSLLLTRSFSWESVYPDRVALNPGVFVVLKLVVRGSTC